MRRGGENLSIRNGVDVMAHRRMDVFQRADGSVGRGTSSRADGRRTFGLPAPAAFEFVESRVELAPLAPGKEPPFECILQARVIGASSAAGEFRAGAPDL